MYLSQVVSIILPAALPVRGRFRADETFVWLENDYFDQKRHDDVIDAQELVRVRQAAAATFEAQRAEAAARKALQVLSIINKMYIIKMYIISKMYIVAAARKALQVLYFFLILAEM